MSTRLTPAAPWRADVEAALRVLGTEDASKPETGEAARAARVLLETVPGAVLVEAMPPLWAQEDKDGKRKAAPLLWFLFPVAIVFVVLTVVDTVAGGSRLSNRSLPLMFLPYVVMFLRGKYSSLTPLQKGILRMLHLRPHTDLTPLMLDTLDAARLTGAPVTVAEHRALLTRFLPVWCEADTDDLTPTQRRTLLADVARATGGGSVWTRSVGQPPPLALADADFAQAAITTLRRSRIAPSDEAVRTQTCRTLQSIPTPFFENDPRHDVRVAADEYLNLLRR